MYAYNDNRNKRDERRESLHCPRETCESTRFTGITTTDTAGCPATYYRCNHCQQTFVREEITREGRVATDGGLVAESSPVLDELDEAREYDPRVESVASTLESRSASIASLPMEDITRVLEVCFGALVARLQHDGDSAAEYVWPTTGGVEKPFVSLYVDEYGVPKYEPVLFSTTDLTNNRSAGEVQLLASDQVAVGAPGVAREGR